MMQKIGGYLFLGVIVVVLFFSVFFKGCLNKPTKDALKHSTIVLAQFDSIQWGSGNKWIFVHFKFHNKIVSNYFLTANSDVIDSIKEEKKVWIRVSNQYPEKYIDIVRVYDPSGADSP